MGDNWVSGQWRVVCARCGLGGMNVDMALDPVTKGHYHKDTCVDKRNPQEFIRPILDNPTVPWAFPDDTEGEIPIVNIDNGGVVFLTASFTNTVYNYSTTGAGLAGRNVQLPSANDAAYLGISINLVISLVDNDFYDSVDNIFFAPLTGTVVGSQTLVRGTQVTLRNIPSTNQWIRD